MDFYNAPVVSLAHPNPALVAQAADLLVKAERPLVIVGKGAAHARAEEAVTKLVQNTKLPFLPTPMGMCGNKLVRIRSLRKKTNAHKSKYGL